ncbi:MAG TPA: hypothetical protein VK196_01120 [Magnetospirillum sp.]|nr:hypothetical protein [Magnetospirillum sp.]
MASLLARVSAVLSAIVTLSSCTYSGGDIGDPLERKAQWFSFVEGEDIRRTCDSGSPDRFRLVYNGVYDEQLRIYEVDGLRRLVSIHVVNPGNAGRLSSQDLLAPWRGVEAKAQLDQPAYDRLVESFARGGMFAPPPVGLELPSRSYYWTAAMCTGGRYHFTAWKYPSDRFAAMGFDADLFALDTTGVPVNQPKEVPFDPLWESKARRHEVTVFSLRVTANGILH